MWALIAIKKLLNLHGPGAIVFMSFCELCRVGLLENMLTRIQLSHFVKQDLERGISVLTSPSWLHQFCKIMLFVFALLFSLTQFGSRFNWFNLRLLTYLRLEYAYLAKFWWISNNSWFGELPVSGLPRKIDHYNLR